MRLLLLSLITLYSFSVNAQTPTPSAHPTKQVEEELKRTKEKEKELKSELKNIQGDLNKKKKNLVNVAQEIKANEQRLFDLEKQIEKKTAEQKTIEESLREDRKSISDLVLALQRIRRVPPEAIIAKPDTPLKTAQSTMLFESILPRIYKRADNLKTDLKRLDELLTSLEDDKKNAQETAKKLAKDQKELNDLLSERQKIYAKTERNIAQQRADLKKISAQARDLRDLVKRIEKRQKEERARISREKSRLAKQSSKTTKAKPVAPVATPLPQIGQAQLPVSGHMVVRYGATDEIGATSKGIKIKSRPNALVVAPMGGIIEYTGFFKNYGNIVIIQHQKNYHSLVAGLGTINTKVGQSVSSGEPIGKMLSGTSNQNNITLYYELRYNGRTVNPSKRISGLR